LFALDDLSGHQRAGGWILLGLIGEAAVTHRAVLGVSPIVFGDQERTVKQPRGFDVVKDQPARWRLRDDHADGHLFENPLQGVAFVSDLPGPALTLGLRLFSPGQVMDDEQSELLIPAEPDRALLDGYSSSVAAP